MTSTKEWRKLYYTKRKADGICVWCGMMTDDGKSVCRWCLEKKRQKYLERKENGICICGRKTNGSARCDVCKAKSLAWYYANKEKKHDRENH